MENNPSKKRIKIGDKFYESDQLDDEAKRAVLAITMAESQLKMKLLELQVLQKGVEIMKTELIALVKEKTR